MVPVQLRHVSAGARVRKSQKLQLTVLAGVRWWSSRSLLVAVSLTHFYFVLGVILAVVWEFSLSVVLA